MEKKEFIYQAFGLRVLFCVPFGIIAFALQTCLVERVVSDLAFYIVSIIIAIVLLYVYYQESAFCRLFRKTGYYWTENDTIKLQMAGHKNIDELHEIEEIFLWKTSIVGSKMAMIEIKADKKKWYFRSVPLRKGEKIEDTDLYQLFQFVHLLNPQMRKKQDAWGNEIDYWYECNSSSV